MNARLKKFIVLLSIGFLLCFPDQIIDYFALPASAFNNLETVSTVEELGYIAGDRFVSNLKDERDNVWQTILSQNEDKNNVMLRLVGYPLVQIDRHRPLQVKAKDKVLFEVEDVYPPESPAFHTAKYSLKNILPQLPTQDVILSFYLSSDRQINLSLPSEAADIEIHCLRDLTRGGLASVLNEIAVAANVGIEIDETSIPLCEEVRGACEILGFDPLYVANEGRFVAFISAEDRDKPDGMAAQRALEVMKSHSSDEAVIIGKVVEDKNSLVTLKSQIGSKRILDLLSGEQLPRIC